MPIVGAEPLLYSIVLNLKVLVADLSAKAINVEVTFIGLAKGRLVVAAILKVELVVPTVIVEPDKLNGTATEFDALATNKIPVV